MEKERNVSGFVTGREGSGTGKAATMKDPHPLLKLLTLVKGHVTLARLTEKTHYRVGK